jgi:hypothetical protein
VRQLLAKEQALMTDTANAIATGIRWAEDADEFDATRVLSFCGSQRPHLVSCFIKKTIEIRGIE